MAMEKSSFDVFVSYRRVDVEFVQEFVDALKAKGKEVWVDWEDIPPGSVGFTDDIRRGLEGSDSFICILSPDYLESTYCVDLELGYAVELNKKLIPIVLRKFEDYTVPAGISHINWIYFTPHAGQENTFDEGFARVIEAIDVDFEYVREHTRFLQRARDWQNHHMKNEYLLAGDEIIAAERMLAQSAKKQPPASHLHHEFIHASRHYETQKTRRNLLLAIGVMIVSVVLAVFAFIQWQEASRQQKIAEEQRAIAIQQRNRAETQQKLSDSRRLAVQSLVSLGNGYVDLALLLGLESNKSADTPEAIGSLVSAFEESPYLETYLYDHPARLTAVAYHPSQSIMVTGGENGSLMVWDMATNTVTHEITASDAEVWDIAFHPDGEIFMVAYDDGSLGVYSADTGEELRRITDAHNGVITSAIFSPDGDVLVTTSYDGNVVIWDADSLLSDDPIQRILLPDDEAEVTHSDFVMDADFSPDGTQLAVLTWDNFLQIWDIEAGTLVHDPLKVPDSVANFSVAVAWSPDNRYILMGDVLGNIRFADVSTGALIDFTLSRHSDHIREIVYSPDGTLFASVSHDNTLILWNAGDGQPLTERPIQVHSNQVNGVAFSPDGKQLVTVGLDERVVLFDMDKPNLLGQLILTHDGDVQQVIYMTSQNSILSTGFDGNVYLTDMESGESEVAFTPEIGRITSASLSSDETLLAIASDMGVMQLWDMATRTPLTEAFTAHSSTIFSIAFNPDGTKLASGGDDLLVLIWDVPSLVAGEIDNFTAYEGHTDGIFAVAWHPTEPILASGSRDDTIGLWDTESGALLATLEGHTREVEDVIFSPDGKRLVSGGRDNSIRVWDVDSALNSDMPISELLSGHSDWVLSLAFSEDGKLLVSGGRDRAIILWNMDKLEIIGQPLVNHDNWVWTVDISPDSRMVVSGGRDSRMVVWDIDFADWRDLACQIANRSLTESEWLQYRPDTDYETTCG